MARQRTLWIRAGSTITFLLIAGVVAARLLSGSPHPMLWNDFELGPLQTEVASSAASHAPARLIDPPRQMANVTVDVNPIVGASPLATSDGDLDDSPLGLGFSDHGPFWGSGHFSRLTSTAGHSAASGGGSGHGAAASTGSLSRVSQLSTGGSVHTAAAHHSSGGSGGSSGGGSSGSGGGSSGGSGGVITTVVIVPGLFTTDVTLPTGPTTPTAAGLLGVTDGAGGLLGGSNGLSLTPEPTSILLTATGLLGLFGAVSKRARRR